jgi:hypothetical protein
MSDSEKPVSAKGVVEEVYRIRSSFGVKVSRIIGRAKYVQKSGFNSFHKYNYATEGDFLALLKPLLDEEKLAIVASQDSVTRDELEPTTRGRRQWLTTVKMTFKVIDGETGYSEILTSFGTGIDSEDKGLYKAITGCVKYFISKLFLIETGDDPERENENETGDNKPPATVRPLAEKKPEPPQTEVLTLITKAQELLEKVSGKTGNSATEILKLASGYASKKDDTFFFITPETLKTTTSEKWLKMTIANLEKELGVSK